MHKQGCPQKQSSMTDRYSNNEYESSILDLFDLVSARFQKMPAMAAAKWPDRAGIDVPAREAEILQDLHQQCAELNADPETIQPFMAGLMEASKYIQQYCFDFWHQSETAPKNDQPMPSIRSELNKINREIIELLSTPPFQLPDPELTQILFLKLSEDLHLSLEGTELIDETITSLIMNGALKAFLR